MRPKKALIHSSGNISRPSKLKQLVWEFLRLCGIALIIKIIAWVFFYGDSSLGFLDSLPLVSQAYSTLFRMLAALGIIGLVTWQLQLFLLAVIFFLALRHQSLGILAKIVVIISVYLLLTPISFLFMDIFDIHPLKWL